MESSSFKVLVLGSGFVARAIGDYFSKYTNFRVTFATIDKASGSSICEMNPQRFSLKILNAVSQKDLLLEMVTEHDLTMSLLPPPLHKHVAEVCIRANKNMVTSSYISQGIVL
jgi:saccharopine dehydrogenase-like NADP-dependent oxidoreductase